MRIRIKMHFTVLDIKSSRLWIVIQNIFPYSSKKNDEVNLTEYNHELTDITLD